VTLATVTGKSIVPVGDIVYEDFNRTTGTIPDGSSNVLGLVSGKHIQFNHQWLKRWQGDPRSQARAINGGDGTLDINASILAVESGSGWQATEYWDTDNKCEYDLKLTGNHILKSWRYPTVTLSNGSPKSGCMGFINSHHDSRLIKDIQPPGFPDVKSSENLWVLQMSNWSESNLF
jgi:hypothetical protein